MDTELARTFLTVISAGNFIKASERLHVTQSTVSARIHALEEHLGCTLFVRNKAGTALTPAGKQFQKHALALVRTVEQARHDVGIPRGFDGAVTVAGRIGLWEQLLLTWLPLMRQTVPEVSVRAEIGFEEDLMQGLVEGRIDIGVMYTPQSRPTLSVEALFVDTLILVSTESDAAPEPNEGYVYVDWGPEFFAQHSAAYPDFVGPALTVNIGWLGLQHILSTGGAGYFPRRLVASHLESGALFPVPSAPEFELPAYVVYSARNLTEAQSVALDGIRHVTSKLRLERRAQDGAALRKSNRVRSR